jgi:hypothetical protein
MKYASVILALVLGLMLSACAGKDGTSGKDGLNGNPGAPGTPGLIGLPGGNGNNGHSIVALQRAATNVECTQTQGKAVDFYVDLDDSFTVTAGDLLQAGIVACNGLNGTDGTDGQDGADGQTGAQGIPGTPGSNATMTTVPLVAVFSCIFVHNSIYARKSSETDVGLYTDSNCTSQNQIVDANLVTMNSARNEVYTTGNILLILEGTGTSMVIKKLVY